ncbi:winged helix-turn-helix domain-containing tetratricopeptide repeat protein [Thermohalobaculum xanthum]|nr:winged helix-turn-helix domain-containing protein [Thermohalobaculum xanthum]
MRYSFGEFTLDPGRLELARGGMQLPLEPQVFDVLHHLVEHRDRVVSAQELVDTVWGGRIVSDAAITSRVRDVRRALGDDGNTQRWIRTIRGRGFRFMGEVLEHTPSGVALANVAGAAQGDPGISERIVTEVLFRPAIAVLPFEDHSEASDRSYLADGLTDEVIGALCAWRWFPVIARNTSNLFRGSSLPAAEIGRRCGARYLLQGSMICDSGRVRLSVSLVDAEGDVLVWSSRITRQLDDLLTLEDEIATETVARLEPEIQGAEMRRVLRKASTDLTAWDLAMRAKWHVFRGQDGDFRAAENLAAEAAEREPGWYLPYTLIAQSRFQAAMSGFSGSDTRVAFSGTLAAARQALEIDRGAWLAHALTGVGELWTNFNHDRALEHVYRAIELNPSAAQNYHFGGCITGFAGDPATARIHQSRIAKLDAVYPYAAVIESDLGLWHLLDGDYDQAESHLVRAETLDPQYPRALQRRIALAGLQGRRDVAQRAQQQLRALGSTLDIEAILASYPFRKEEHRALLRAGFLRSGLNA